MIIAIQGIEGSFHHIAAHKFFGKKITIQPCLTFKELITLTKEKKVDFGMMAIENSIVGSILPNYSLLQSSKLHIVGEVYLKIHQHLLANKGVTLKDIKEIHSHPMAILQCSHFIEQYKWKIIESEDTALSAKKIAIHKSKHASAIGSKLAAEIFGMQVLSPNIHSLKNNYTRFLVLKNEPVSDNIEGMKKASIYFEVEDKKGSLGQVLARFAYRDINLVKLQSSPVPGSQWKYYFHADVEFQNSNDFHKSFNEIQPITHESKIYGIYKMGKQFTT